MNTTEQSSKQQSVFSVSLGESLQCSLKIHMVSSIASE